MDNPINVVAYSKTFLRNQELSVNSITVNPKFNGQDTAEFTVPINSSASDYLSTEGERVICTYRGQHLISGVVSDPAGIFTPGGLVTYQVDGDWRVLENTLAAVAPRNNIAALSTSDIAQAWQTGTAGSAGTIDGQSGYFIWPASISTAEAAIKHILSENLVTRLGRPVRIMPNQNRGGDARAAGLLDAAAAIRFQSLSEAIAPILEFSQLRLAVIQNPGDRFLTIEVSEPVTWPTTLSLDAGILNDGTWARRSPTATRAIVTGPGDGAARAYLSIVDTALEALYNDVIEVVADASSATLEWPSNLATALQVPKYAAFRQELTAAQRKAFMDALQAAGAQSLSDGAPAATVGLTLAETDSFHFHGEDGIQIGTLVNVKAGKLEFSDRLTGATVLVGDSGLQVTPILGAISDDEDDEVWSAIDSLARSLRKTKTLR